MSNSLKNELQGKLLKTSTPPATINSFLHVPLGSGGTFTSPSSPVGTSACINTVGVFFEINPSKAFCAHIDAFVTKPSAPASEGSPSRKFYGANFRSAAKIRDKVLRRLIEQSIDAGWTREAKHRMQKTLVVTCRRKDMPGEGTTQVADIVTKAVMEWLIIKQKDIAVIQRGGFVFRKGAAFVAEWPGGSVREFEGGVEGFTAVDAEVGEGAWTFGVEEEEIKEVEGSEKDW